jgi:adenylate cyclase
LDRKLTAILCADVFGYSRLMGQDEEATLRTLSARRKVIDGLIEQHHGRFVNSAGDSVLAEFASVVNAVRCAVEIQSVLKAEKYGFADRTACCELDSLFLGTTCCEFELRGLGSV